MQRVQRAHVELMGHPETMAYAGVLMVGKYEVRDDVPTARTNGIDCQYGSKFIKDMTDSDLRGLIVHENLHKVYQHMFLWQHLYAEDGSTANKACDYVINLEIDAIDKRTGGFITLPKGGLLNHKYVGMDSQTVYNMLREDKDKGGGQGNDGEGDGDGDGDGNGDGDGGGFDEHDWQSGKDMSQEDIEQVSKDINQAIRQGQLMAGKLGGNQSRELGSLIEPKIDWREQLREYVSSTAVGKDISTWQRVNRRWLQHDTYMPSTITETVGRIVVAPDMSGSVGDAELSKFLSEVQGICINAKPEKVDLLYWDTDVAAHEVYTQEQLGTLTSSTKPAGGGGTDVTCVSKYLKDNQIKPECVIVLTDGYIYGNNWGTWNVPVLWVIVGGNKVVPPMGTTIYLD
jgi:predicted metal-dependent peptidase